MINHDKLTTAACKLRDLTIERNIVHLKAQIAQSEASELHNRARKLDHEVMCAAGDLSRAATEDVPEIFRTNIGGDNEAAKQMIAKLVVLRDKKEYHPPTILVNGVRVPEFYAEGIKAKNEEIDKYLAKRVANHMAGVASVRSMDEETSLTDRVMESLDIKHDEDTSPWDSTIE